MECQILSNVNNKVFNILFPVPDKVYHINEMDAEEAKKMTMSMSMDGSDDDRWWEQTDLTRLYLSSNQLNSISPKISNLLSLQILDVRMLSVVQYFLCVLLD